MENTRKLSAADRVYSILKKKITDGEVGVGEKIPTENAICISLGVGRSTVREATRMLQAKGYVEIKRGSGTYVVSATGSHAGYKWLLDNREAIEDYMDVRIAIESLAVQLFIKRATPEDVESLRRNVEEFGHAVEENDGEALAALDEEFHELIARATRNDMLLNINELLADSFRAYRRITFDTDEHTGALEAHRKITDALQRRDTNDASYYIKNHLATSVENAWDQARRLESGE